MTDETENKPAEIVVKYSSYTEAQKKATKKYRAENKEKVNEQRKKYYQTRKEKDPDFLTYKREKAKEYYSKKKSKSGTDTETETTPKQYEAPQVENPKPERAKKVKIVKTDEQKKAEKKMKQFLKADIITQEIFETVMKNITDKIYFFIDWEDKKGKLKKVEFFKAEPEQENPKPETDTDTGYLTTDTENIIIGDEEIMEQIMPDCFKTPEKQKIEKVKTPRAPRKPRVQKLVVEV